MATLHQFDYIFAFGVIFAFIDAWNIGANDVANSFATSVSSRSLTLTQAMIIATFCEFLGAVLVGSRVADTIRKKLISTDFFEEEPAVLMLAMVCALVGSSTWLTIATRIGLPVSTTHTIIGGVIGAGVAALGADGINWGWKGVSQVFAAWAIAPCIAGCFGAILFLITKYGVLKRKNPLRAGFILIPFFFFITSGVLTMLVVWKGAPYLNLDELSIGVTLACIFGAASVITLFCVFFFLPYLHRRLVHEDWTLRWYHVFLGPLLLRRGEVPPPPAGQRVPVVQDYYRGHKTKADLDRDGYSRDVPDDIEVNNKEAKVSTGSDTGSNPPTSTQPGALEHEELPAWKRWYLDPYQGAWYEPKNLPRALVRAFFHGVDKDVVSSQNKKSFLSGNLERTHATTPHYDNKTEHLYSFLQVLTAGVSSFGHGANDVSNAMGPFAAIYLIWSSGTLASKSPVPVWILAFGGGSIVVGLWTYGYHIMRNLGNRITLHSPTRGFSMELGAAMTVILATRLALPVSTTQCIVGATVGVGLCSGNLRSVNWRMVMWSYAGWILTLPAAGIVAGCLMAIIINAPQWGNST